MGGMQVHADRTPFRPVALFVVGVLMLAVVGMSAKLIGPQYARWCHALSLRFNSQTLGALIVLLVVVLWTASSIAVQGLVFESAHYRKPFFVTYFSTAMLMVYLPFYPRRLRRLCDAVRGVRAPYELVREGGATSRPGDESTRIEPLGPCGELLLATRVGLLFFASQLCFVIGLEWSTVSSVTLISASSSLWTLLLSVCLLGERAGPLRVLATALSFLGIFAVVRFGGNGAHAVAAHTAAHGSSPAGAFAGVAPRWGNGLALFSAVLYGLYACLLKREASKCDSLPVPYLFGLIGLSTSASLALCVPVLHAVRLERFVVPTGGTLLALTLNALVGSVVSNVLLARAMILASPLVATMGLSLSIPLALGTDVVRGRARLSVSLLAGATLVWAGFLLVTAADLVERRCGCAPAALVADAERAPQQALGRAGAGPAERRAAKLRQAPTG